MKLIRFLGASGLQSFGALQDDGKIMIVEGDPFGEYRVTTQPAAVAKLLTPIEPVDLYCIGLNYRKHAAESGKPVPEHPVLFMKASSAVQNPGDPIELPRGLRSDEVDFEAELAVVIGRDCKNATPETALDYVLGYTCANDVSARDWQGRWGGSQWCRGKTFDTFCPLGPCLVTPDELPNPNDLAIRSILNGQVMQDWTTSDMIFDVPALVAFLSGSTTLRAGTVILTGTPHGVGFARKPPIYLQPGDTIEIEIDGIGRLSNPVVEEAV